jgi:RecA/RadA recombinase
MAKKPEPAPVISDELSKNLLHAQLQETKATHFNYFRTQPVIIPSGSLTLDNYLKIKTGCVIRMGGPAEVGKTSQSLLFAQNFMAKLPNSKTIYVNAEAKFGEEIQKRTGLKFTKDPTDWDYGTVFILDSNCFDTICDILVGQFKQIHQAGGHLCVIVDSVDMLRLKSSFDAKVSDSKKPAGVNYLTKEMFRHLSHIITAYNGLLIMITQYAAQIKMDQYEKDAPNLMDGNQTHALNHQASYALYYRPRANSHYILEKEKEKPDPVTNKILGVNAKVDVRKSSTDETGYVLTIPIRKGKVGNCIWVEKELFDALLLLGLVTRKGSWIELDATFETWLADYNKPIIAENEKIKESNKGKEEKDKKPLLPLMELKMKHQGLSQFSEYFESNPRALAWLVEKIRTWHS